MKCGISQFQMSTLLGTTPSSNSCCHQHSYEPSRDLERRVRKDWDTRLWFTSRVNSFCFSHSCLYIVLVATRDSIASRIWKHSILWTLFWVLPSTHFCKQHFLSTYLSSSFLSSCLCGLLLPGRIFLWGFILCLQFSTITRTHLGQGLCFRKEL